MARRVVVALAGVMLAGCAAQQTGTPAPGTGWGGDGSDGAGYQPVTGGKEFHIYKVTRDVTVRTAPHAGADSEGDLHAGDRLKALTTKVEGESWTRIRLPNDRRGYVFGFPFDRLQ